jgi:hypothetical protein
MQEKKNLHLYMKYIAQFSAENAKFFFYFKVDFLKVILAITNLLLKTSKGALVCDIIMGRKG